jgi:hypothetical protein
MMTRRSNPLLGYQAEIQHQCRKSVHEASFSRRSCNQGNHYAR